MHINRLALREVRERSGYSKSRLAREAGVSVGTVADIESGRRRPSPNMVVRLAHALKVPLASLLACPGRCEASQ